MSSMVDEVVVADPPLRRTLCRFHHRIKTRTGWSYRREHPDLDNPHSSVLRRTSPLGETYTVDETGTYPHH